MKELARLLVLMVSLSLIMGITTNAEGLLKPETKFGMPVEFQDFGNYEGDYITTGAYIYASGDDYVVTLTYEGGDLTTKENIHGETVESSFFSPPNGDILMIHYEKEFDRISSNSDEIVYTVPQEPLKACNTITIRLYDKSIEGDGRFILIQLEINEIDFSKVPDENQVFGGYSPSEVTFNQSMEEGIAAWAEKDIQELVMRGILRDEALGSWKDNINRREFVYLMVSLYEALTDGIVDVDSSIRFSDTDDTYAIKAAQLGITNGIGEGLFGPEMLLTREQMTTFMIRTLNVAAISLELPDGSRFNDDELISEWAKESVYIAKTNGIMNGVGEGEFSPQGMANNEQALVMTNRLLNGYSNNPWLSTQPKDRVYFNFDDKLYSFDFMEAILFDAINETIYMKSMNDIDGVLGIGNLTETGISYDEVTNPNVEGRLIVDGSKYIQTEIKKLYRGVDTVGERTEFTIISRYSQNTYKAMTEVRTEDDSLVYENFKEVFYYTEDGDMASIVTLPLGEVFELLGIEMRAVKNQAWGIVEVSFNEVE